jgi:hypothetical protein
MRNVVSYSDVLSVIGIIVYTFLSLLFSFPFLSTSSLASPVLVTHMRGLENTKGMLREEQEHTQILACKFRLFIKTISRLVIHHTVLRKDVPDHLRISLP